MYCINFRLWCEWKVKTTQTKECNNCRVRVHARHTYKSKHVAAVIYERTLQPRASDGAV